MRSRRASFLLLVAVVATVVLSACAVTDPPALRVNGAVFTSEQLFDVLGVGSAAALGDPASSTTLPSSFSSAKVAQTLTNQVYLELVNQELAARGLKGTAADKQELEQITQQQSTDEIVDRYVLAKALAQEAFASGDANKNELVQQLYESSKAQLASPAQTCFHVLVADDADAATKIVQAKSRLATEPFETVAADFPSQNQPPKGDAGCVPDTQFEQFPPDLKAAITDAPLGVVTDPISVQGQLFIVLRVDERKPGGAIPSLDSVRGQMELQVLVKLGGQKFQEWLKVQARRATIEVNSRYGTWNPETLEVDPPEGATKSSVPTTLLPTLPEQAPAPTNSPEPTTSGSTPPGSTPAGSTPPGSTPDAATPAGTVATTAPGR